MRGSCSGLRRGQAGERAAPLAPTCGLQVLKILLWLLRLAGARGGGRRAAWVEARGTPTKNFRWAGTPENVSAPPPTFPLAQSPVVTPPSPQDKAPLLLQVPPSPRLRGLFLPLQSPGWACPAPVSSLFRQRLSLGWSSQQRLFSALCSFRERLTLQVPALCTGPQFPHLQTEGASSGLPLLGQALAKLPSPSRTPLPLLSLFLQWGPHRQGKRFPFWASVYPSAILETHCTDEKAEARRWAGQPQAPQLGP